MTNTKTWTGALIAGLCAASLAAAPALAEQPTTKRHHFALGSGGLINDEPGSNNAGSSRQQYDLTAEHTEGRMTLMDEIWTVGFKVAPHFHKTHTEIFYIIDGQVKWTVAGETHIMTAGDVVYIPPNTVHSVEVVGDKPLKTLMIYEPGGYEYHMDNEARYTEEQRKDPKVQAELDRLNDFHRAN